MENAAQENPNAINEEDEARINRIISNIPAFDAWHKDASRFIDDVQGHVLNARLSDRLKIEVLRRLSQQEARAFFNESEERAERKRNESFLFRR